MRRIPAVARLHRSRRGVSDPPRITQQDGQHGHGAHDGGIIKVTDDAQRREAREPRGHEQLGSVGQQPLREAGEGVEQAGAPPAIDAEPVGDLAGNRTDGKDGDRVVGRAEVREADQSGNRPLGPRRPEMRRVMWPMM